MKFSHKSQVTSHRSPVPRILSHKAKIISNSNIKDSYFEIIIEAPEIAKYAQPGQFLNIKVSDGYEPLLRRPFSIHRVSHKSQVSGHRSEEKEYIVMLYEAVGKGTEILSQRKEGEFLDVIGPLGNGFNFYPLYAIRYPLILVAGGMGTAPLVFLAERLAYSVERIAYRKNKNILYSSLSAKRYPLNAKIIRYPLSAKVLIGAKTKTDILCEKEFEDLGCEVKIATDDGSRGFKGYVSELLKDELSAIRYPLSAIYACGPAPMLKEISLISRKYHIPAQISLEAHMACGIGACMGCVVKAKKETSNQKPCLSGRQAVTRDGFEFRRVCKDGPVFEANQILWE